jgi:thermostable 8-oxoguanine DNA glycosylase
LETPKNIQQAKIEKLLMPRSNNVGIDVVLVDRTVGYKEARHLLARVGYFG